MFALGNIGLFPRALLQVPMLGDIVVYVVNNVQLWKLSFWGSAEGGPAFGLAVNLCSACRGRGSTLQYRLSDTAGVRQFTGQKAIFHSPHYRKFFLSFSRSLGHDIFPKTGGGSFARLWRLRCLERSTTMPNRRRRSWVSTRVGSPNRAAGAKKSRVQFVPAKREPLIECASPCL